MLKKLIVPLVIIISLTSYQLPGPPPQFVKPLYEDVPLGSIHPTAWLHDQLYTMRDGWEETPYWLDGAVPLTYLLADAALKTKVLKCITWTIDHQRPSGYFGPI